MGSSTTTPRARITDSPWFWVYLYSTFGLVLLALFQPKFKSRQAAVERQYQGRQRAIEVQLGQEPTTEVSTSDNTIITLRPLFVVLGVVLVFAWTYLWWTHFRRRPLAVTSSTEKVET